MAKKGNDSVGGAIGAVLFGIVVIIAMIPKPVWIALGITAAAAVLCWVIYKSILAYERTRAAAEEQARIEQAAQAAAAKRARAEQLRREKQQRIDAVGRKHADLIDLAWVNVKKVGASEAARAGWLGDVDFSADIAGVTDSFEKAHALRKVTEQLAALDKPSAEDRRILTEATKTAAALERSAVGRLDLIERCAKEAALVDKSLQQDRKDARTAEQRAELHGQLSAMLYGIEAPPQTAARDSTADAVMARVAAYREIKNQIQLAREN